MLKIGIITDQIGMDFESALQDIAAAGLSTVEIHGLWGKTVENLSIKEAKRARHLLQDFGLKVSNIGPTLFFMCPLFDSTSPDDLKPVNPHFVHAKGDYAFHIDKLKKCFEIANILDTSMIRIFGFRRQEETSDKVIEKIAQRFEFPVQLAERAGMALVLENCHYTNLPTGMLTYEVIKKIESQSLKLLWDMGNTIKGDGIPYPDEYQVIKNDIAHIHVKNLSLDYGYTKKYSYDLIDRGIIDYRRVLPNLVKDEYNGVLSLEPEYSPKGNYKEGSLEFLQSLRTVIQECGLE